MIREAITMSTCALFPWSPPASGYKLLWCIQRTDLSFKLGKNVQKDQKLNKSSQKITGWGERGEWLSLNFWRWIASCQKSFKPFLITKIKVFTSGRLNIYISSSNNCSLCQNNDSQTQNSPMIRPKRREGRKAGMQCTFESFGSVCLRNNWMRLLDNFTWLITRTISQTHFCHRRETGSVFPRHRYSKLMTFKEIVLNKNRFLLSTAPLWAA